MPDRPSPVDEQLLGRFVPMSALGESYLRELSHHARFVELCGGDTLHDELASVESILYLVDGSLCYTGGGLPDVTVRASDPGARFALPGTETAGRHVRAEADARLLRVNRAKISTLLIWAQASDKSPGSRDESRLRRDITALLLQSRLFERIPPSNIERVGELIEPVEVKAGDIVVRQGEPGDYYYIIEQGECEVLREGGDGEPMRLAELKAGDSFGEEALLTSSERNATVRMLTDGTVMRLTRKYFVDLISSPLIQEVSHERAEDLVATGARWLDVRLPEEFERDGLDDAVNIPLGELRRRAGELRGDGSYVTYCNTGRRAQAGAFLLSQRGRHASCLREGIAMRRPVHRGADTVEDSLPRLHASLLEVNAELDRALQRKAEADAALDVQERLNEPSQAEEAARQRQEELAARADRASELLRAAMNRKRELDAKVREVEAREAGRRREAEAACERLRKDAEQRLEGEKRRLSERYRKASDRLREIESARRQAEERFEQERARVERELAEARARMEAEAARIRETMEAARKEAETRAQGIRSDYVDQEARLRRETETSLREERSRLEEEFSVSIAAQEKARHELDLVEAARVEAERETNRLRTQTEAELGERRRREVAERNAEVARLQAAADEARARLETAQHARNDAEQRRTDYSRTLTENLREVNPQREAEMRRELAAFDEALASADDALEEAEQAHASATQAQSIAVQTAAAARTRAEVLRLQLYEEMEEWISAEEERSREELEQAERYAREIERIQSEKEARRAASEQATESMFSDIQQMLDGTAGGDPVAEMMRSRIAAEEKARLVQRARREAAEQIEKARAAMGRGPAESDPGS